MSKNAIIVGMARSGTSMTTAIFARKGYFVAENKSDQLQVADRFNPSGYWEAEPLLKSNREILNNAGFTGDNTWFHNEITTEQANKINKIEISEQHKKLIELYQNNSPWVWKDPRLCYTLGYWWPHLDQENTQVILLQRNPIEIYKSFKNVEKSWYCTAEFNQATVFDRIEKHIESARQILNQYKIPYIELNYSEYSQHPEIVAKRLSDNFDIDVNSSDLGFSKRSNHSTTIGKLSMLSNNIFQSIATSIIRVIKSILNR